MGGFFSKDNVAVFVGDAKAAKQSLFAQKCTTVRVGYAIGQIILPFVIFLWSFIQVFIDIIKCDEDDDCCVGSGKKCCGNRWKLASMISSVVGALVVLVTTVYIWTPDKEETPAGTTNLKQELVELESSQVFWIIYLEWLICFLSFVIVMIIAPWRSGMVQVQGSTSPVRANDMTRKQDVTVQTPQRHQQPYAQPQQTPGTVPLPASFLQKGGKFVASGAIAFVTLALVCVAVSVFARTTKNEVLQTSASSAMNYCMLIGVAIIFIAANFRSRRRAIVVSELNENLELQLC